MTLTLQANQRELGVCTQAARKRQDVHSNMTSGGCVVVGEKVRKVWVVNVVDDGVETMSTAFNIEDPLRSVDERNDRRVVGAIGLVPQHPNGFA